MWKKLQDMYMESVTTTTNGARLYGTAPHMLSVEALFLGSNSKLKVWNATLPLRYATIRYDLFIDRRVVISIRHATISYDAMH